jgi:predicted alpha/beta hydrolase family esterase
MKKAIILHGTAGSSNSSWLQWLGNELGSQRFQVWIPDLPNANNPSLQEWFSHIKDKCPFEIDSNTIIVGHSAGAVLAVIIAQFYKVNMTFSVGVFKDLSFLQDKLNWHANDRFFDIDFDFEKIKQNSKHAIFIHSDNDPYCPLDQAEYLSNKLDGKLVILEGQGHFNTESDVKYKEFPELLNLINSYL